MRKTRSATPLEAHKAGPPVAPPGNGHARLDDPELEQFVNDVWAQGRAVPGVDAGLWRQDACGAWIRRDRFGRRDDPFGWKMESVAVEPPVLVGLLRPFHWRNRYDRDRSRPVCVVTADHRDPEAPPHNVEIASARVPQVGAPDPELETSPIFDDSDEISLDQELEAGACYFNGAAYPLGQVVMSGEELLRCDGKGVWVRAGERPPKD